MRLAVHIKQFAPLTLLAFLAACPGDSTAPNPNNGALSFNFAGSAVGTGSMNVSGDMPNNFATLGDHDAAGAAQVNGIAEYEVLGVNSRGSGRYDVADVSTGRLSVGTTDIDPNCNADTEACSFVVFITNASPNDQIIDEFCVLASGSVTISEVTDAR